MKNFINIKRRVANRILLLLLYITPVLSFYMIFRLGNVNVPIGDLMCVFALYAILYMFNILFIKKGYHFNSGDNKRKAFSLCLGLIMSFVLTMGPAYQYTYSCDIWFTSVYTISLLLVDILAISIILSRIIMFSGLFMEQIRCMSDKGYSINYKIIGSLILVPKIIMLILFYPGIFGFDSAFGLRTILDPTEVVCSHHPVFVQMIHGMFFRIGKSLGDPAIGYALLSILFIIVSTAIIMYAIESFKDCGIGKKGLYTFVVIFVLFPIFPILSINPEKDGMFAYFFMLYMIVLFNIARTHGRSLHNYKTTLLLSLSIIMVCLTRNQGVYIVIITSLFQLVYYRKYFRNFTLGILTGLLVVICFNNIYLPYKNVAPGSKGEVLGTLFQQTALYCIRYDNEVTNDERNSISSVLKYENIRNKYDWRINDPVKGQYVFDDVHRLPKDTLVHFRHVDRTDENVLLSRYLKTWLNMFGKHPVTYFDATANVTNGFFYDCGSPLLTFDAAWENSKATSPEYSFKPSERFINDVPNVACILSNIPLLNLIFGIPLYVWLAIFFVSYILIFRKGDGRVFCIPELLSLLILVMCPVVTGRYVYPIVTALPIIFIYILSTNKKNEDSSADSLL